MKQTLKCDVNMKKKLLPIISAALLFSSTINYSNAQNQGWCITSEIFNELINKHPEYKLEHENFEKWIQENSGSIQRESEAGPYIIPVVVHVIHNYGLENISDAQIASGIAQLNLDFQGTPNADHTSVVPEFQSIIGHPNIEFRLAKIDPNGNCTNGITRTASTTTYNARDNAKVIYWPRNKYYNIWIVSNIYTSEPGTVTGGYAYYPGSPISPNVDGILVAHNYFGTIGTSSGANFNKRVVSHETGHFLNLKHPWGDGNINVCNCGWGDGVGDTPCTSGSFSTCNLAQTTCDGNLDNVQNIMDYSTCTNMFTIGQVDRMITALNSGTGQRNSLITTANAIATGTNDGYTATDCAPKADFIANKSVVCKGETVTFTDHSWNGPPTSWHWSITNGTNTITDNNQNPTITFPNVGIYTVTLTASNSTGNGSVTKTSIIKVIDNTPEPAALGFYESFENVNLTNGKWNNDLSTNPNETWKITNNVAYSGTNSAMFPNISATSGLKHNLYSPNYDFSNVTKNEMTFKYAYARVSSDSKDILKVFASTDCGATWIQKAIFPTSMLHNTTIGNQINNWAPLDQSNWGTKTLTNLSDLLGKPSVMFRFEFTTGGGNNLYIDDINIGNTFGISTPEYATTNIGLTIFPNPSDGIFTVRYHANEAEQSSLEVVDLTGRVIYQRAIKNQEGFHNETIQLQHLPAGMYFVNMIINNKKITEKVIIQ